MGNLLTQPTLFLQAAAAMVLVALVSQYGGGVLTRVRNLLSRIFRRIPPVVTSDTRCERHKALCLWRDFAEKLDDNKQKQVGEHLDSLAKFSIVEDA